MDEKNVNEQFIDIVQLIPKVYFKLTALTATLMNDSGVTPGQRALLEDIDRLGPQSVGALAALRPVAKQYVQKLVADLAEAGFVRLKPNPNDGRSKLVSLSRKGRQSLSKWRAAEASSIEVFLATVDKREVASAYNLLQKLNSALEQAGSG